MVRMRLLHNNMKKLKRHKRAACTRLLVEPAAHFNFKSFLIAAFCFSLIIEVNQDYDLAEERIMALGELFCPRRRLLR